MLNNSRGQSVLTVILSTVFILTLSGFGADISNTFLTRQYLRKLADATAMAAVVRTPTLAEAIDTVHTVADLNTPGASNLIDPGEIEVGNWDFQTRTFTPGDPDDADNNKAVRVTARRDETNGNPLRLVFGSFVGVSNMNVVARATAAANYPICGIIGVNSVTLGGDVTVDSYDSGSGPYTPPGSDNGTVCSDGDIALNGNVEIHGDVLCGKEAATCGDGASVTGTVTHNPAKLVIPPVDLGDVATNNDNALIPLTSIGNDPVNDTTNEFSIGSTETLTLSAGTYYFTLLEIKAQAQIIINDGPVIIYVDGDVRITGNGIANATQIPNNLQIFVTGSQVTVNGGPDFFGLLYAPNAVIDITGNTQFYGALVGTEIRKLHGTADIHYDEGLDPFWLAVRPVPVLVE